MNKTFPAARALRHMLCGVLIGLGCVLPGVSGGVLAVTMGLYRPMLDAAANLFKNFKKNVLFLLPIGIGAAIGIFFGAIALAALLEKYEPQVLFFFIGLIAGGLPAFLREANEEGFRLRWLWAMLGGAALCACLLLLDRSSEALAVPGAQYSAAFGPLQAIIAGAILALGSIIPGISTSFILLYLGWYQPAMTALADRNILLLTCLALGCAGCALLTIKLIRWLFDHARGWAYYGVLGFLLVSMGLIFPGLQSGAALIINLLLLAGGAAGAYCFDRFLGRNNTPA